ncbi:MAG: hypothetical protein WCK34_00790 [Bacteroidota bacterium]
MKRKIVLLLFIALLAHSVFAQYKANVVRIQPDQELADAIRKFKIVNGPAEGPLLIFESKDVLKFKSNRKLLETIPYDTANYHKYSDQTTARTYLHVLQVSEGTQILTAYLSNPTDTLFTKIGFGEVYGSKIEYKFPECKKGDIRVFKVSPATRLECTTMTPCEYPQVIYEKEAKFVFELDQNNTDLKLNFRSTDSITWIDNRFANEKRYFLYLKPRGQILTVWSSDFEKTRLEFDTIYTKSSHCYKVTAPRVFVPQFADFSLLTYPDSAVISIAGLEDFSLKRKRTPYEFTKFPGGKYEISLALPKYDTLKTNIFIGNPKEKSAKFRMVPSYGLLKVDVTPKMPYTKMYLASTGKLASPKIDKINKDSTLYEFHKGKVKLVFKAMYYYPDTVVAEVKGGDSIYRDTLKLVRVLRPVMGSLSVPGPFNAMGADVYRESKIAENRIGTVPLTDYLLQEGSYRIIIQKGNVVFDTNIIIALDKPVILNSLTLRPDNDKRTVVINARKVEVQIDGGLVTTKHTPFKQVLTVGEHTFLIKNEYCDSLKTTVNVLPHQDTVRIWLNAHKFPLNMKLRASGTDSYTLLLDGTNQGNITIETPFKKEFDARDYTLSLKARDGQIVYKTRINHPNWIRQKVLWIPSWGAWSLGSVNFSSPVSFGNTTSLSFNLMSASIAGLTVKLVQFEDFHSKVVPGESGHIDFGSMKLFSFIDPEFRIGVSISNWCDFSLFANAYVKIPNIYEKSVAFYAGNYSPFDSTTYKLVNITGYKYGIAVNIFPHSKNRWSWASLTFRAGIRDETLKYNSTLLSSLTTSHTLKEQNFFISLSLNLLTHGDGMVLRVVKTPLAHLGGH